MSHIIIWKYRETDGSLMNYFDDGNTNPPTEINYLDKIKINQVPSDAFPQFDESIESVDGLLEYVSGDFDLKLSLLSPETSYYGHSLNNFLFPEQYPNKFLVNVYFNDDCHFTGTFTTADLSKDLTYSQNQWHVNIHVTSIIKEFAEAYSMSHRGTRLVPIGNNSYSFEPYLVYHFDDKQHWTFEFPSTYYGTRINDNTVTFSSTLQNGIDQFNGGDYWSSISRWETFKELAKGMGFNYQLTMKNPANAYSTFTPDFTLKIIFIPDIANESAIDIGIIEHNEEVIINSKQYVFAGNRNHVVFLSADDYSTVINGILFSEDEIITVDENAFSFGRNFRIYNTNRFFPQDILLYEEFGARVKRWSREALIAGVDYAMYPCPRFGAYIEQGTIAYSRMFMGSNLPYDNTPVMNYLATVYKRYLTGNRIKKRLKVLFDGTQGLQAFKRVVLGGVDYVVWSIDSIDMQTRTAEITTIEI